MRVILPTLHAAQEEIRKDPHRFKVVTAGRRFGKSSLGVLLAMETALLGGKVWWVAPIINIAQIGWDIAERYSQDIPGTNYNLTKKTIVYPSNGVLQIKTASDPKNLRGSGLDLLVIDEAAFVKEEVWTVVLRPSLSDKKGRALFISSPNGMNWFYELYLKGQCEDKEYKSWKFRTIDNPLIDPEEIEAAKNSMTTSMFAQEYLSDFLQSADVVFTNIEQVIDQNRVENTPGPFQTRNYLGVDLARKRDFSVLTVLDQNGKQLYFHRFNKVSWSQQTQNIIEVAKYYKSDIYMDSTGIGDPIVEAVSDGLQNTNIGVYPINFTKTSKPNLINNLALRIEKEEIDLMNIPEQTEELKTFSYKIGPNGYVKTEGLKTDDIVSSLALSAWGIKEHREFLWS